MTGKRASKKPLKPSSIKVAAPLRQSPTAAAVSRADGEADVAQLVSELGVMIDAAQKRVAVTANATLVSLYWQIGHRVRMDMLEGKRATYGTEVVAAVGKRLEAQYGRGFSEKNLRRMVQFSAVFPDTEIVAALMRELGWTHFTMLIPIEDAMKREFYAEMCRVERWSTRDLRRQIDSMLFERTALSKKPDALIRKELSTLREKGELTPSLVFRDPYMLDFLGLADIQREGPRIGNSPRDRTLPPGARIRFCIRRAAETHHARRR